MFSQFILFQGNKNVIGNVNALGMAQLGNKSPNIQSPQASLPNNLGMNSMAMSIANNGNQPMSSMQGKFHFYILSFDQFCKLKKKEVFIWTRRKIEDNN